MVLFLLSIDRREGYFFEIFWEHPYPKSPPPSPAFLLSPCNSPSSRPLYPPKKLPSCICLFFKLMGKKLILFYMHINFKIEVLRKLELKAALPSPPHF